MPSTHMEDRLSALEREVAQLKLQLASQMSQPEQHPWAKVFGSFANSEGFDDAVRLGREYREAQRPSGETESD